MNNEPRHWRTQRTLAVVLVGSVIFWIGVYLIIRVIFS